jgi:hypothetical protein
VVCSDGGIDRHCSQFAAAPRWCSE